MQGLGVRLRFYEDGQLMEKECDEIDRWELHGSHQVNVSMGGETVILEQAPQSLKPSSIGVGAVLWEGELLLAKYLCSMPRHRFLGCRVVELGAGPGLLGILLAKMGAQVVITDKHAVLPLIQRNVDLNNAGSSNQQRHVEVAELEWGKEGFEQQVAALAQIPVDWVLAADCLYIDNEGKSPSIPHFVRTCSLLCASSPKTKCLVSFELRSELVKQHFLEAVSQSSLQVKLIPKSALPKGCQVDYIELYELSSS